LLRVRVPRKLRRRMSLAQALGLSITITSCAIVAAAAAVTYTDPEQFPHLGVGLWWAAATVTTVGYGDVVPSSPGGRLIGAVLMFLGIASLALLTAIAASAIVVGEVRSEGREIEKRRLRFSPSSANLRAGFPGSKASPTNTSNLTEGPLIRLASVRRTSGHQARSALAMFAPPICRRSRRNASRTELILRHDRLVGSDEDGGSPGERRSERSERLDRAKRSERSNQAGTTA
jgi:hypothetical protein